MRRPSCADCGAAFTDARWQESRLTGWGKDDYPQLCDACKAAMPGAMGVSLVVKAVGDVVRDGASLAGGGVSGTWVCAG